MTAPTPTLLDRVEAVVQTPGLLAAWELVPKASEVRHHGAWLLVDEIQGADPAPGQPPRLYLRLEGPVIARTLRSIDKRTGIIAAREVVVKTGPLFLTTPATLWRARLRKA